MSKHFVRSLKNITNRYTSTQITVRNATSNEPWGPSSSELHEIAVLTYHEKYVEEVLDILQKRLNDKGKNWRHVMKALTILLHCIYEGSDTIVDWLKQNLYLVKTLREFRCVDVKNIDQGQPIRTKARLITEMIESPEKMAHEKQQYRAARESMGRPGIVDLATGNSRHTFDFTSSGRPRTSNSSGIGGRNSIGNNGSSQQDSFSSPRTSLDIRNQQLSPGSYRQQKGRVPQKSSMEGRYSLSFPLHSIQEESHPQRNNRVPEPEPFQSSAPINIPSRSNALSTTGITASPPQRSLSGRKSMPTIKANQTLSLDTSGSTIRQINPSENAPISVTSPIGSKNPFATMINQEASQGQTVISSSPPLHAANPRNLMSPNTMPHLSSPQPSMLKSVQDSSRRN